MTTSKKTLCYKIVAFNKNSITQLKNNENKYFTQSIRRKSNNNCKENNIKPIITDMICF